MAQPTIKDVAKLAGVSISTVSRVMNDSKPVSPEARKKVLDAINKLDFKPNQLARSLVMKKSNLIGVIVEDIGIEYMAQLIRGVEEIGHLYKYNIILSSTYGDDNALENAIEFLSTKQVEGIVVISEDISAEILVKLRDNKIPFLLLDKLHDFKKINTVKIDYEKEQYELIKHLYEQGHENIAYVTLKNHNYLTDTKISSSTMSKGKDLSRSTLGIIGMDDIGISISRRARAFGMTVVYHNESPRNDDKLFMTTYRELDDLLAHSDVVIVMNSARNSKKVMCNTSFFNAMKDDAIFISATTTEQIDLEALRKTLHEGKLNYAALAVDNEFDSNTLLETDKCLVVPMSAAFTERSIKEIDSVTVMRMIKELQNSL